MPRYNKWQLLWFIATVLLLFAASLAAVRLMDPFPGLMGVYREFEAKKRDTAVARDLETPACAKYATSPFDQLSEPPYADYGGGCYQLYLWRKYHPAAKLPYTIDAYHSDRRWDRFKEFLIPFAACVGVALLASVALYLIGWTVGLIRRRITSPR